MAEITGQQLRAQRESRRLSLEQASQATRIKVHYLRALETGDLASLPSQAQARGFLRSYAEYLGLDADALILEMDAPAADAVPPPAPASQIPIVQPGAPADYEQILIEIGHALRGQRELLGLSLEDIERHTHLRQYYLQALETGDLDLLPSPVQGRGMLANYASFLGMDPEPLLLRFADGLQARLAARQSARMDQSTRPVPSREAPPPGQVRRRLGTDWFIGGVLVIALAGFMLWGAIRIFTVRSTTVAEPTAPSIADVLLATATPTITATYPAVTLTIPAAPGIQATDVITDAAAVQATLLAGGSAEIVSVVVTVRQRAWMRVSVDGEVVFQGRVLPGSAYNYEGSQQVEVLTGNGAGLQVFYNQQDLGLMGEVGQIVQRIFTREGILTPTPTITLQVTTTPTPRLTETPTPTRTLPPGFFPVPTVP